MTLYSRHIKTRDRVNSYGRIGYYETIEFVMTNDIDSFNYRKKIRFEPITISDLALIQVNGFNSGRLIPDNVYSFRIGYYDEYGVYNKICK